MIKEAEPFEIDEIIQLGKKLYDEALIHNTLYEFCGVIAKESCMDFITDKNKLLLLCLKNNKIIGFFWAALTTPLASNKIIATDMMLFVLPEHRGALITFKFIKYYENWARTRNAELIELSVSSGINHDRTLSIYSYLGYKPECVTYCKEL